MLKLRVVAMNSRNAVIGKMRDIVLNFRTLCNTIAVKHVEPVDFYHVSNNKSILYCRPENNRYSRRIDNISSQPILFFFYLKRVIEKVRLSETMITQILMHLPSVSNFYFPSFILPYTKDIT